MIKVNYLGSVDKIREHIITEVFVKREEPSDAVKDSESYFDHKKKKMQFMVSEKYISGYKQKTICRLLTHRNQMVQQ